MIRKDQPSRELLARHTQRRSLNDIPTRRSALARSGSYPIRRSLQQGISELAYAFVQTLLVFLIFTTLIGRFEIHQTSMEPTFHEGQRVMVSQVRSFWLHHLTQSVQAANDNRNDVLRLKRGQVVVFFEHPTRHGDALIKRLIALPGDTLEIDDGRVIINGQPLDEPYIHHQYTWCDYYCGPLQLGADDYFFMGDNRSVSRDSRSFGPIPAEQIVGPVVVRFWPLDQMAFFL